MSNNVNSTLNSSWFLRDCVSADYDEVLKLNSASTPMVNEISLEELQRLGTMSSYFRVAVNTQEQEEIIGALLVLPHQQDYSSLNYQWFNSRYENFRYIDRVFIKQEFMGLSIGRHFYQDLLAHQSIDNTIDYLCCEVNIKPMNAPSVFFHRHMGFAEVGQRDSSDNKRVSLLVKKL